MLNMLIIAAASNTIYALLRKTQYAQYFTKVCYDIINHQYYITQP